jgi:hypothetical protein
MNKMGYFFPEEKASVIERENSLSGYFCIITSEKMTANEALNLYKSRDASEKLFRGDKSYLGDKNLRIYGDSAADSKIFIEFIALIIRNRIYSYLKDEMRKLDKRPDFMTVPAALKELEKIEMVRLTDNKYRLDHAVTTTLKAFGIDASIIKHYAEEISIKLEEAKEMVRTRKNEFSDTIEQQIEKVQIKVVKSKAAYKSSVSSLQVLLDKRDAIRKDEFWKEILKSEKTYEEILRYIKADNLTEE